MESTHIAKLFSILEATSGHIEGRSLSEIASEVGLAKSTAHRLLKSLCSLGYMAKIGSGTYRQTALFRHLANGYSDQRLIHLANGPMVQLQQELGETINLGVVRMERVVYMLVIESRRPLRRIMEANMCDPALCTALGRAIVAFQPEERQRYVLRKVVVEKRTPHTVVETHELEAILHKIRIDGYAVEENQTDLGVICIAAPIFDAENVVAAISMSCPTVRIDEEGRSLAISAILKVTTRLSELLGYHPSSHHHLPERGMKKS